MIRPTDAQLSYIHLPLEFQENDEEVKNMSMKMNTFLNDDEKQLMSK